jgi:hypothetical protein
MNESALWSAAAVILAAFVAWASCRWWHQRRIGALLHDLQKMENAQQNAARMSAQMRKQIDDLQRTVAEYRRRIATHDAARRARPVPVLRVEPEPMADEPAVRPGGWADTQPM